MSEASRILIVEDEADTRANLCDILGMFGYQTFDVGTAEEALALDGLSSIDVIVLDRKLPDLQADEVLPQLRERGIDADVIIATGHADLDGTISAVRHGAADYLLKPINPDALHVSIERCLERRQLERENANALTRLRMLGAAVSDLEEGLLICEAAETWFESRIVFGNHALQSITGYSHEDLPGHTPQLLEGTGTERRVVEELDRHLSADQPTTGELIIQRQDGRQVPIELHLSPVRDASGARTHTVATLRDISQRKAAEEQALQAERLAAIGKAMTGLAHESRNALQRSQAALDMLSTIVEDGDPDAAKLIQRIQVAQDDLHRLYEDVREYARPVVVNPTQQRIDDLLHQAWDELIVKREGRQTKLKETAETEDLSCEVEPFLIRQVFRNILDNSLAACIDPVEVAVRWQNSDLDGVPALSITLHDNGPGVPPESRHQILDEFFTTKTRGTGLGLAIVNRFVAAHQGRLQVGNVTGFALTITLPRSRPA